MVARQQRIVNATMDCGSTRSDKEVARHEEDENRAGTIRLTFITGFGAPDLSRVGNLFHCHGNPTFTHTRLNMLTVNCFRVLTGVLFFSLTAIASGQTVTRSGVRSIAVKAQQLMLSDPTLIDKAISANFGSTLSPEKRAIASKYMLQMVGHPKLPEYMIDVLQPVITVDTSRDEVQSYMLEGMLQLKVRGLRRLSHTQQASFLKFTVELIDAVPVDICKALVNGKIDARKSSLLELHFAASQPKDKFVDYMALQADAVNAELVKYPDVRVISQQQALNTEKAHALAFQRRVDSVIPGYYERVANGTASARDECLGARAYSLAGLDLRDPYRGWFLMRFMDSLQ